MLPSSSPAVEVPLPPLPLMLLLPHVWLLLPASGSGTVSDPEETICDVMLATRQLWKQYRSRLLAVAVTSSSVKKAADSGPEPSAFIFRATRPPSASDWKFDP